MARTHSEDSQDPELLRRLLRAKDRMDAASDEEWPVRRLARVSGVSEAHFARSFKQAFGVPPHRYLLTRRIERATALLRDTDLPITEIAFQTGWNSLGTFGRTFHDITGENPRAIRARARAAAHDLGRVPVCILSAAHRPHLTIAVSEKRRRVAGGINASEEKEVSDESGSRSGRSVRAGSGRSSRVLRREARVPRPHGRSER
jgi:AraC-like DNA-binding protein